MMLVLNYDKACHENKACGLWYKVTNMVRCVAVEGTCIEMHSARN